MNEKYGIIGQWIGMLTVLAGIIVEVSTRAEIGHLLITVGSLIFAISTKIRRR